MGFEIGKLTRLPLGYQGESNSRQLEIDVKEWLDKWPGAAVNIMVKRPGETEFYPAASEVEDGILIWVPTRADLLIAGKGVAQIILTDVNDVELRTRMVETIIEESIAGTEGEAPEAMEGWLHEVLQAAQGVEEAVDKMPAIGENGNWLIWDPEAGEMADSGITASGKPGKAATIKVGKVTTLAPGSMATVINSGSESEAVLDFGIPQGMQGTGGGSSGGGTGGEDGGYYLPTVTEGILTWAPSKAGMPEVGSSDIRGPAGKNGQTPIKGTDYWTEADKQEMLATLKQEAHYHKTAVIGTTWDGSGPYTQSVAVEGLLETDIPITDLVASTDPTTAEAELTAWAALYRIDTADGSITVYANEATTQEITIQMVGVR